jgi:hypothetical protein
MAEDLPPVEVTGGRRGGGFGVDSVHFHEFSCSESEGVGEELERGLFHGVAASGETTVSRRR